jgi:hypothetical protein
MYDTLQKDRYMKIGYMFIGLLFGCYFFTSFTASEHEKVTKNMAALSLSASPSGASFVPPSTPPISIVSPYRDEPSSAKVEQLPKLTDAEKRRLTTNRLSKSMIILERSFKEGEEPLTFEKVPIVNKVVEENQERPLSASVDSREDLCAMDVEE